MTGSPTERARKLPGPRRRRPVPPSTEWGRTARIGVRTAQGAGRRLRRSGPNAVRSHRARGLLVLWHQLRSPLLGLLMAAAVVSYFVGERNDAVIIGV
ncbi:cation-transporting P-type ATPase [Streptomyces sp. NPDC001984]|uniref:cation-transporting P-type ATPase n=1 Tax=Streptomyces sp. NPDC002619 TaxID=3364655 RepID=UPI0036973910